MWVCEGDPQSPPWGGCKALCESRVGHKNSSVEVPEMPSHSSGCLSENYWCKTPALCWAGTLELSPRENGRRERDTGVGVERVWVQLHGLCQIPLFSRLNPCSVPVIAWTLCCMEMLWLRFGFHNPNLFCPVLVGMQLVLVQGWRSGGRGKPAKCSSQTPLMTLKGLLPTLLILVHVYI